MINDLKLTQTQLTANVTRQLANLMQRIVDELNETYCIVLAPEKVAFFDPSTPLFGDAVATRFGSASYDIDEAGKCLALRRATACVFHLMRILEIGLNRLADVLSVPFSHTNWNTVIEQIEKKIKAISPATHGSSWKDEQQFYAEAATHFRILKDAWRNHAMHVRERYTEEKAETVFRSTRDFMRHLAERLRE